MADKHGIDLWRIPWIISSLRYLDGFGSGHYGKHVGLECISFLLTYIIITITICFESKLVFRNHLKQNLKNQKISKFKSLWSCWKIKKKPAPQTARDRNDFGFDDNNHNPQSDWVNLHQDVWIDIHKNTSQKNMISGMTTTTRVQKFWPKARLSAPDSGTVFFKIWNVCEWNSTWKWNKQFQKFKLIFFFQKSYVGRWHVSVLELGQALHKHLPERRPKHE